jgi:hypothetical protein
MIISPKLPAIFAASASTSDHGARRSTNPCAVAGCQVPSVLSNRCETTSYGKPVETSVRAMVPFIVVMAASLAAAPFYWMQWLQPV